MTGGMWVIWNKASIMQLEPLSLNNSNIAHVVSLLKLEVPLNLDVLLQKRRSDIPWECKLWSFRMDIKVFLKTSTPKPVENKPFFPVANIHVWTENMDSAEFSLKLWSWRVNSL